MSDILVSIWCTSFNHELFIRDALEGFVRQKTNFRYEIIIHDDASTDGTKQIIEEYQKKYPDLIIPIFQMQNQFSKGVSLFDTFGAKYVRGKYIAMCEGDDFWTDEEKLQKQVDFLEQHPDYSMCCHAGYYVDNEGYKLNGLFKKFDSDCTLDTDTVIKEWICPTASIVYNYEDYMNHRFPPLVDAPCGDYPKIINFSLYGKIYYFSEVMCAYRINETSLSASWHNASAYIHKNEKFIKMLNQIDTFTNFRYRQSIDYMRAKREYENLCLQGKMKEAQNDRYSTFVNSNRKRYYYYCIKKRFPFIERIKQMFKRKQNKATRIKISYF